MTGNIFDEYIMNIKLMERFDLFVPILILYIILYRLL